MLISKAYAAAEKAAMPPPPEAGDALLWNVGLVIALVVMFYLMLIRPQQKRFQQHSEMLKGLKKGDKVVTGGGLIGKIDTINENDDEVIVDLGNGLKVTALRSTIHSKDTPLLRAKPANDPKKAEEAKK